MPSRRPRVKSTFPAFFLEDTVYFQGCGSVTEIADPNGTARRLVGLLDGTRTIEEARRAITAEFPDVQGEDVAEAIAQLDDAGLVEDGAAPRLLDDYGLERWSRNLGFFETYASLDLSKHELQRRLQETRVGLLGVGGVGSHLLLDLAAMGVADVRIVDFDTIELSNLNRQILYTESDIGRRKVEAAAERALALNSQMTIDAMGTRLESEDGVRELVEDRDVVIAAVDRPKMQVANWVNAGCVQAGVALLTGGVDTQRCFHYTVLPGRTGCVECWRSSAESRDPISAAISAEMEAIEEKQRRGERFGQDLAAFCPLVTAQTAFLVTELVRLATGIAAPVAVGRLLEARFEDLVLREAERWERLPECPICGGVDEVWHPRWERLDEVRLAR
jgi:molybdopterin/thiamine biosynthesis adenylyltransferase